MKKIYTFCLVLVLSFQVAYPQIELETVIITNKKVADTLKNTVAVDSVMTESTVESANEKKFVRYFYYPNLSAYYDLKSTKYIYQVNGVWVMKDNIPLNYRGYSVYNNNRVQIKDYFGDKPFELLNEHRKMYPADYTGKLHKIELMKERAEQKQAEKSGVSIQ